MDMCKLDKGKTADSAPVLQKTGIVLEDVSPLIYEASLRPRFLPTRGGATTEGTSHYHKVDFSLINNTLVLVVYLVP